MERLGYIKAIYGSNNLIIGCDKLGKLVILGGLYIDLFDIVVQFVFGGGYIGYSLCNINLCSDILVMIGFFELVL
tara:strand:- start:6516 stop:6740 length:225 start_codon:yes stop_codon:yes gene_type:complete